MKSVLSLLRTKSIYACRFYSTSSTRKRFYKNTNVLSSDGLYEITLDQRKLKTPNGNPFVVKSEPLAIAVATEWNNQKDIIVRSSMHLTALCNTSLDNPNHLSKPDMVNYLLNFLPTDTVLFQSQGEADLAEFQQNEWDPVIEWFNKRYETNLKKTLDISPPQLFETDRMNVSKYLLSNSTETLHGFIFAVDTLKSIILACATIDRFISVEKAVYLARLEEEYQLRHWGRVEWSHDLSQLELQARLAASVLFIHFNRAEHAKKEKLSL
ncbi:ATPAF2 family protein [Megaselia abdita]